MCAKARKSGKFSTKCPHRRLESFKVTDLEPNSIDVNEGVPIETESPSLLVSALSGELDAVKAAILNGYDSHECDYDNRTALHLAAADGHLEVVEFLLSLGDTEILDVEDRWGFTPLTLALHYGQFEVVEYMKRHGAVNATVSDHESSNLWGSKLCSLAAEGNLEELQAIVESGGDVSCSDITNRTALHLSVASGHVNIVNWLVEHSEIDVNAVDMMGVSPLQIAIDSGNSVIQEVLREHGAIEPDIAHTSEDKHLLSELCELAFNGELDTLRLALSEGKIDVNLQCYDGRTLLHNAVSGRQIKTVEYLVDSGADPSVADCWGLSSYRQALHNGFIEIARLLDQKGQFSFTHQLILDDPESDMAAQCCRRFGKYRSLVHSCLGTTLSSLVQNHCWDLGQFWSLDPSTLLMHCCEESSNSLSTTQSLMLYNEACKAFPIEALLFFGGKPFLTGDCVFTSDCSTFKQSSFPLAPAICKVGFKSMLALPISLDSGDSETQSILGIVLLYSLSSKLDNHGPEKHISSTLGEVLAGEALFDSGRISSLEYGEFTSSLLLQSKATDFIVSLLFQCGTIPRLLEWGCRMNSEDHKAILPFLRASNSILEQLISQASWGLIWPTLFRSLRFLATTSPEAKHSPVITVSEELITHTKGLGLHSENPPYFGPGKQLSPVFDNLMLFRIDMEAKWEAYPNKDNILQACRSIPLSERRITPMQAFTTVGKRNNVNSKEPGEADRVSAMLSEFLQSSEYSHVTVAQIKGIFCTIIDLTNCRTASSLRA